jgi:hypothetical protein
MTQPGINGVPHMVERSTPQRQRIIAQRATTETGLWSRFKERAAASDFQLVLAFSLIGLLIGLNLMFRFPEYGAIIAQYNQF